MNTAAILYILATLCTASLHPTCTGPSQFPLIQNGDSLKPGDYWTLSSSWGWNATGAGDQVGWRKEREDWNDTVTVKEVSGSELVLGLKRLGRGSLEASGSFIIGGRSSDSWEIDRDYSFKVNTASFRDADGKPVRWITDVKELDVSGSVPQTWTDENYAHLEVQFRVAGYERLNYSGLAVDTWVVSYRNLTAGYWSWAGKHSIGFKEETLNYDKKLGLLSRARYDGTYNLLMREDGWNETETYVANVIDSNFIAANAKSTNLMSLTIISAALAIAGAVIMGALVYGRRKARSELFSKRRRTSYPRREPQTASESCQRG